jgi:hypothetical protein
VEIQPINAAGNPYRKDEKIDFQLARYRGSNEAVVQVQQKGRAPLEALPFLPPFSGF